LSRTHWSGAANASCTLDDLLHAGACLVATVGSIVMNGPASLVELDDLVAEGWPRPRGSPIRSIWPGLRRKSIQQRFGGQ